MKYAVAVIWLNDATMTDVTKYKKEMDIFH